MLIIITLWRLGTSVVWPVDAYCSQREGL